MRSIFILGLTPQAMAMPPAPRASRWDRRLARWPCGSFSIRPPPNRTCKFPSIRLSSGRILRRSALGITPTSLLTAPVRLPPFALWSAFPASDYYGGSVALGLAPLRQSRIPYWNDDQDGLGAHFVPLR